MAEGIAYILSTHIPGIKGEFQNHVRYQAKDAWEDYMSLKNGYKFDVTIKQRNGKFTRIISEEELERLANA